MLISIVSVISDQNVEMNRERLQCLYIHVEELLINQLHLWIMIGWAVHDNAEHARPAHEEWFTFSSHSARGVVVKVHSLWRTSVLFSRSMLGAYNKSTNFIAYKVCYIGKTTQVLDSRQHHSGIVHGTYIDCQVSASYVGSYNHTIIVIQWWLSYY